MFHNYLKITLRNLRKYKLFSITNIAGLSIGVLCCLLILMYVSHEMSYEKWNPRADRIVRVSSDINFGGSEMHMAVVGAILAPDAKESLPEVEEVCRFRSYGSYFTKVDGTEDMNITIRDALTVDSTFFHLFPIPMLAGDPATALTKPSTLVLSEKTALTLFPAVDDALGKVLILDNDERWEVTGVYAQIPSNTHFQAEMLLAMNGNREVEDSPPLWAANNNFHTFLLLREGVDYDAFAEKFESLSREKVGMTSSQLLGMSLEDFEATGQYARFSVMPIPDIHLYSDYQFELMPTGDIRYIWIFASIALFVLLIACINFMNLTTAKATQRSEEIAVRKVLGGNRKQLIYQFLGEAILMASIAVVLAFIVSIFLLPWFNELTGKALIIPWDSPLFWSCLVGGVFVVGLIAGSYPAFFLSSFKPIEVLKDPFDRLGGDAKLRSGLVVFQFVIASSLIIGTFVIYQQLQYIQKKELGFQKDQVIVLNGAYALGNNVQAYKQAMLQHEAVSTATISSYLPIPSSSSNSTYSRGREFREDLAINMDNWYVDFDYMDTYGIDIIEGRFFDQAHVTDSMGVVLNESAIDILGFEEPLGMKIYGLRDNLSSAPAPEDFDEYTIIGIAKNFHYRSLRENIGALGFFIGSSTGAISFRFEPGAGASVISQMESTWNEMAPGQPFSYRFVDESFASMYDAEQRVGTIAMVFSILAIIVSCLGLFGLSTFVVQQRTKEIGIRKVLGASVPGLVTLLCKGFIKLVLIAFVLAVPLAWYGMSEWLSNFAYRIDMGPGVFVWAGLLAMLIAFLTISLQSFKAATSNPVEALRSE